VTACSDGELQSRRVVVGGSDLSEPFSGHRRVPGRARAGQRTRRQGLHASEAWRPCRCRRPRPPPLAGGGPGDHETCRGAGRRGVPRRPLTRTTARGACGIHAEAGPWNRPTHETRAAPARPVPFPTLDLSALTTSATTPGRWTSVDASHGGPGGACSVSVLSGMRRPTAARSTSERPAAGHLSVVQPQRPADWLEG
jgi:hypothetical protein